MEVLTRTRCPGHHAFRIGKDVVQETTEEAKGHWRGPGRPFPAAECPTASWGAVPVLPGVARRPGFARSEADAVPEACPQRPFRLPADVGPPHIERVQV